MLFIIMIKAEKVVHSFMNEMLLLGFHVGMKVASIAEKLHNCVSRFYDIFIIPNFHAKLMLLKIFENK